MVAKKSIQEQVEDARKERRDAITRLAEIRQSEQPANPETIEQLIQVTAKSASEKLTLHHLGKPGFNPHNSMGLNGLTAFELYCLASPKDAAAFIAAAHEKRLAAPGIWILGNDERAKIEAEILKDVLALDRKIEALICEADEQGTQVPRDDDADERAVLELPDNPVIDHDYFSEKLDRLESEAQAASGMAQSRREILVQARDELQAIEREDAENPKPGENSARYLKAAQGKVERAQTAYYKAMDEARRKRILPGRLRNYIEARRKPTPTTYTERDQVSYGMVTRGDKQ